MTENTQNPTQAASASQAQAEKIRADLMAAMHRAAKAGKAAPAGASTTNPAPAEKPVAGGTQ